MGRYRKYKSDKLLRQRVEGYFASISREKLVMEMYNTGQKDAFGHFILEWRPVTNDQGVYMREREFLVPPTVGGLCEFLEISRETWSHYCNQQENPQFAETTGWAREQLLAWREKELLRRGGKMIRGLLFDLQVNYGMREKESPAASGGNPGAAAQPQGIPLEEREKLLREIGREFGEMSHDGG